jgi:hypothetical protein
MCADVSDEPVSIELGEMSLHVYQAIQHHILLHNHLRRHLKPYTVKCVLMNMQFSVLYNMEHAGC